MIQSGNPFFELFGVKTMEKGENEKKKKRDIFKVRDRDIEIAIETEIEKGGE